MIRIRFNLGRGSNYKKWKITNTKTKEILYINPNDVSLLLNKCTLVNNKIASDRIFNGHNKYVCAWIECESYSIIDNIKDVPDVEIKYNPRIKPNWTNDNDDNLDDYNFNNLITLKNKIYWLK